jgi:hypothetical protein
MPQHDLLTAIRNFDAAHLDNPIRSCKSGQVALNYLNREGDCARAPAVIRPGLILLDLTGRCARTGGRNE